MRKILAIHYGGEGGIRGSEACFIQSVEAMHHANYEVLFARNRPVIDSLVNGMVKDIIPVDIPEILIKGRNSQFPILAYLKVFSHLAKVIKAFRPDLIYVNGGLPCQLAVPLGIVFRTPVLCHFHHPANRRYYYCWLVPFANKHIFPSRFTQSDARSQANISGDIVYNGVDTNRFLPVPRDHHFRESLSIDKEAIVVGQVGQLVPTKRPLLLLSAFSKAIKVVPKLHLCLVGRGPLEEQIKREVARHQLEDKVTVTGYVEDVLPYYQHVFDINALVSSEEGLGISILEGASCALPSLISNCTGLSETIIDNVTGKAFHPEKEEALVNLLTELATDRDFCLSAGAAGRHFIEEKFSLSQYQSGVIAAIERAIRERKISP